MAGHSHLVTTEEVVRLLEQRLFPPPVNMWQGLETCLVLTWGEGAAGLWRGKAGRLLWLCCRTSAARAVTAFPQVPIRNKVEKYSRNVSRFSLECQIAVLWLHCWCPSCVMGGKLRKGSGATDTSGIINKPNVPPHHPIYQKHKHGIFGSLE